MNLREFHGDGNNQRKDIQIIKEYENEGVKNFNLFENTYCYYIRGGYKPRRWIDFTIPKKELIRIIIKHKSLN